MPSTSVIGPSITITGDITADEPLTIAGRVDGTVSIPGHSLTVENGGQVNGELQADTIILSGHVTGAVLATGRIAIRETAVVDSSLLAPVLRVEEGAEIRGKLDIEGTRTAAALKLVS